MDIIEKYINETERLNEKEKKLAKKLYFELSKDPDSSNIESKFDKVLEKEKNG